MPASLLFITATRLGDAVLSTGVLAHCLERLPGARVTVGALTQSAANLGLEVEPVAATVGENRLPAFGRVFSDTIDRDAYLSTTITPEAGKVVRIDRVTLSTEQVSAFAGATRAALATSLDGFDYLYELDLQPGLTAETWNFVLGRRIELNGVALQLDNGLQISGRTELRIYAWGMPSQPLDAGITLTLAAPGAVSPLEQGVARVNDGDIDTVYRVGDGAGSGFQVAYDTARAIDQMDLVAAADRPGFDPVDYEVYGSNDAAPDWEFGTWTLVGDGPTGLTVERGSRSTVTFANTTAYRHYKVVFPTLRGAEIGRAHV